MKIFPVGILIFLAALTGAVAQTETLPVGTLASINNCHNIQLRAQGLPQTIQVPQQIAVQKQRMVEKTVQVPRTVMEKRQVEIQVPTTVLESKTIQVPETYTELQQTTIPMQVTAAPPVVVQQPQMIQYQALQQSTCVGGFCTPVQAVQAQQVYGAQSTAETPREPRVRLFRGLRDRIGGGCADGSCRLR